jgi:hypothetical protein
MRRWRWTWTWWRWVRVRGWWRWVRVRRWWRWWRVGGGWRWWGGWAATARKLGGNVDFVDKGSSLSLDGESWIVG